MGLLKQKYGFFGIQAGKIWHAALPQWPQDSWMSQAVSASTPWQLQRVLTPFPQDKVWNAGRRESEQPGRNLSETDSRKGRGAECSHDFTMGNNFLLLKNQPRRVTRTRATKNTQEIHIHLLATAGSPLCLVIFPVSWMLSWLTFNSQKNPTLQLREILFLPKIFRMNWQPNVCGELELDKLCLGQHNSQKCL